MTGGNWLPARWRMPRAGERMHVFESAIVFLSHTSLQFDCARPLSVGQQLDIQLPCVGSKRAVVAAMREDRCSCTFIVPLRMQDVGRAQAERARIMLVR